MYATIQDTLTMCNDTNDLNNGALTMSSCSCDKIQVSFNLSHAINNIINGVHAMNQCTHTSKHVMNN